MWKAQRTPGGTPGGILYGKLDGIILGAGAAGLVAALRAASLGARVALLDGRCGADSNLVRSGGMFSAAGTRFQAGAGIEDGPARWESELRGHVGGALDPIILRAVMARAADAAHFLADHAGLDLHLVQGVTLSDSTPRLHATPSESGRELSALLLDALHRFGETLILLEQDALALEVDEGRVVGARTRAGVLRAPWTLLANGGFGANRAMLAAYAPEVRDAAYIGSPHSVGSAAGWAAALGAELLFMGSYQGQGHVVADKAARLGPGLGSFGAIVVNAGGRRFADETASPSSFAAPVLAQPGGWAVELFDEQAHQAALRFGPYREAMEQGATRSASTIEGLAALFGLPVDALADTLAEVAALAAGQADDPFGRTRHLRALRPPFHAARITGGLAHTQGGVRVDASARALRQDGTPIAGLLAAGGAAASISGSGAAGYVPGNGLAHAFALGLIAGETMAATAKAGPGATGSR